MTTLEHSTPLPHSRSQVFDWFERPGALVRLTPPFAGHVTHEPSEGIAPGSVADISVVPPGRIGLAAVTATGLAPAWLPTELPWTARHIARDPGHSFTDVMESGPLRAWSHQHEFVDDGDGCIMRDRIDLELPRALDNRLLREKVLAGLRQIMQYRGRQVDADLAFHQTLPTKPRTIAVTGASGLIGRQVCAMLEGGGHRVLRLVRRRAKSPRELSWDPEARQLNPSDIAQCDVVIHLAGHNIGGRFTRANKRRILQSRVNGTRTIAQALAALAGDGRSRALICASAIGIYGTQPHAEQRAAGREAEPITELTPPGPGFLAEVCKTWESACQPARDAGVRAVNIRTGLVLTPQGGLLTRFLPLYLLGIGGPLGARQWQSWVGIDDIAASYVFAALRDDVEGPVNAVAPEPVQAKNFAKTLGRVLGRPAVLPVPGIGPRLLLGRQGAQELAEADQRVAADKLIQLGYHFRHFDLESQLRHVLGRTVIG